MDIDELDHPCKQTCSGWRQGFDKSKKKLDHLTKERDLLMECVELSNKELGEALEWCTVDANLGHVMANIEQRYYVNKEIIKRIKQLRGVE